MLQYQSKRDKLKKLEQRMKAAEAEKKQQVAIKKSEDLKITKMFEAMPQFSNYPTFYGLSGLPVKKYLSSEATIGNILLDKIDDLKKFFDSKDLAILVPNENNVAAIKDLVSDIEITTFKKSKGCEWFAGIIIVDNIIFNQSQIDNLPSLNSANSLYVAMTRFRQEVIVISIQGANSFRLQTENIREREYEGVDQQITRTDGV